MTEQTTAQTIAARFGNDGAVFERDGAWISDVADEHPATKRTHSSSLEGWRFRDGSMLLIIGDGWYTDDDADDDSRDGRDVQEYIRTLFGDDREIRWFERDDQGEIVEVDGYDIEHFPGPGRGTRGSRRRVVRVRPAIDDLHPPRHPQHGPRPGFLPGRGP